MLFRIIRLLASMQEFHNGGKKKKKIHGKRYYKFIYKEKLHLSILKKKKKI